MKQFRQDKGFASLVLVALLAVLMLVGVYKGYQYGIQRRDDKQAISNSQTNTPEIVIAKVKNDFDGYATKSTDLKQSSETYVGAIHKQGELYYWLRGSHTALTQKSIDILPTATINALNSDINAILTKRMNSTGLANDANQTFESREGHKQINYSGKNIYCSSSNAAPETAPFTYLVTCYNDQQLQAAIVEQGPILAAFGKKALLTDIKYSKINNNFVQVGYGVVGGGGGAVGLLKKTGSTWKLLTTHQNEPACKDLDGTGIPVDLVPMCLEGIGQERAVK